MAEAMPPIKHRIIDYIEAGIPAWMYYTADMNDDTGVMMVRLEYCDAQLGFRVAYDAPAGWIIELLRDANASFSHWMASDASEAERALWMFLTGKTSDDTVMWADGLRQANEFSLPVLCDDGFWWKEIEDVPPFADVLTEPILETMLRGVQSDNGNGHLQRFSYFPQIKRLVFFR
jgi:hypothetical protein